MGRGKENLTDYDTKHHPMWHHRSIWARYLKPIKTTQNNENTNKMELEESVLDYKSWGNPENR